MQTSTTLNIDNLSETEKQIILKQREQDKLKAEEKALKEKLEAEKQIAKEQQNIIDFVAQWTRQNIAANQFLAQLNEHSTFEAVINPEIKKFEVKTRNNEGEYTTVWEQSVNYNNITIKHTVVDKTIIVEEHITGSWRQSLHHSRTNHGFKMRIAYGDNRYTKDPKNMASKFTDELAQIARKEKEKNNKATAQEQALQILTDKYPGANIEHKTEWVSYRHYGGGRRQGPSGYEKGTYTVTFKNGYSITFNYELLHDGKLHIGYESMQKPSGFDHSILGDKADMVNALINAIQNIA